MSWQTKLDTIEDASKDDKFTFCRKLYREYEHTLDFQLAIVKACPEMLLTMEPSEDLYMAVAQKHGYLMYMKDPSYDVKMAAVKADGRNIAYIDDQTEEMCLEACKSHPIALSSCFYRSEEICLAAIKQDGSALAFAPKQTDEMCKIAISHDATYLRFVNNQTEELCWLALKADSSAFIWIKKHTDDMIRYIVNIKANKYLLQYAKISEDLMIEIVSTDIEYAEIFCKNKAVMNAAYEIYGPRIVFYIDEPPENWCLEAVSIDSARVCMCKTTEAVYLAAINENPAVFVHIPKSRHTKEICLLAVSLRWQNIFHCERDPIYYEKAIECFPEEKDTIEHFF